MTGTGYSCPLGSISVLLNNTLPPTTTTLSSSFNPSNYGQSVTFSATVTSSSGAPSGTVIFYNRASEIGSVALSNGSASLSTSSLPQGSDSITAAYQASSEFAGSTSSTLAQRVIGLTTATSLTSSPNPAVIGQYVSLTATVTSPYGTPANGETVTFYNGSAVLGTATLNGGSASLNLFSNSLGLGTFSITASYPGDTSFGPSTSGAVLQRVESKYHILDGQ